MPATVIAKILTHLGLPARAPPRSAALPGAAAGFVPGGLILKPQANNGCATAPTGRRGPHSREALKLHRNRSPRGDAGFEQCLREGNFTKRSCD